MGMTIERRVTAEPEDVLFIELECKSCGGRVTYPTASRRIRSVAECPHCGIGFNAPSGASLGALLNSAVVVLAELNAKDNKFRLRFGLKPEA